jgi:hypothetical protein
LSQLNIFYPHIFYLEIPFYVIHPPNLTAEWLTPLLHVLEVPASNIGLETGCPEVAYGFPQLLQARAE